MCRHRFAGTVGWTPAKVLAKSIRTSFGATMARVQIHIHDLRGVWSAAPHKQQMVDFRAMTTSIGTVGEK
jgi:hypothetical protein